MRQAIVRWFGLLLAVGVAVLVAGCGGGGGSDSALINPAECLPAHFVKSCYDGDVYWYNSCGRREDKAEECGANACVSGKCEAPVTWAKTFGGSYKDSGYSVRPTSDSGYVVAGSTDSTGDGNYDGWVLKLDYFGNKVWENTFGGSDEDRLYSIQQTSDGGYVVAGYTASSGEGMEDGWVLRLDSSGDEIWEKTYGGPGDDMLYSIGLTTDGGFVVSGLVAGEGGWNLNGWWQKLDSSGSVTWAIAEGSSWLSSISQTADGGYIAAGTHDNVPSTFGWVLKLESSGSRSWENTFDKAGFDWLCSISQVSDGGYIAAGQTEAFGGWVLKLDSSGGATWEKELGGAMMSSAVQTSDGGYIAAGYKGDNNSDGWLVKLDTSGDQEWERSYGGPNKDDTFSEIVQAADGGFIIVGTRNYTLSSPDNDEGDLWVVKLDSDGNCDGCFE